MTTMPSRSTRRWWAVPWALLGGLTAYWIGLDPDNMWADIQLIFWLALVAAPLAVGLALATLSAQWLWLVGALGLLVVGPVWIWSLLHLPVYGAVMAVPPLFLVAGVLWLAGLTTAFQAMVIGLRHR
jgi:hypothetical protein